MVADKCVHCNKGIRRGGGFSGSFYPVDRKPGDAEGEQGDPKVHLECFEVYQAKLAEECEGKKAAAAAAQPEETEPAAAGGAAAADDPATAEKSTADATTAVANPVDDAEAEAETGVHPAAVEADAEADEAKESS